MKEIILCNHRGISLVDDSDYEMVIEYRWYLLGGNRGGYAVRWINKLPILMHREILGLTRQDPRQGDHINRNRLDNQRSNLRIVTDAQNRQNRPSYKGSSSCYRGVSFHKYRQKWYAYAQRDGRQHSLGYFNSEEEAANASANYRAQYMPFSEN